MSVWNLYVGTFTSEFQWLSGSPGEGIERYRFDDTTGTLRYLDTTTGLLSPQYLTVHPHLPVLYAAEFAPEGNLTIFAIQPDGSLDHLSTTSSLGALAVAVSIHPSTEVAYVANWGGGSLTSFRLDAEGRVLTSEPIAQRLRPDSPAASEFHPHHIRPTPSGGAVVVAYAGLDEVTAYRTGAGGILAEPPQACITFPSECAPRHIEFHPSGKFVYVVGERDSYLYVLEAEDGFPTGITARYPTAPPDHSGRNTPSELKIHPDGQALYIGNRGSDCITVAHLNGSGDRVVATAHVPSLGRGPRTITIAPTGRHLVVGNADSGELGAFTIEADRGLRPFGSPEQSHSPSSLVFVRSE
jgi:6-phosphogluconolactonase (cycloisomerase 2 family)